MVCLSQETKEEINHNHEYYNNRGWYFPICCFTNVDWRRVKNTFETSTHKYLKKSCITISSTYFVRVIKGRVTKMDIFLDKKGR